MDTALREILKEEKKRKERRSRSRERRDHKKDSSKKDPSKKDPSKKREEIAKRETSRHGDSRKHRSRSEPRRRTSASIEITKPVDDGIEKFMFVYENSEGKLFSSLDKFSKKEGDKIKIFPVYVAGYQNNLTEEEVTFKKGKLVSEEEESWLSIIDSKDPKISVLDFELSDVVASNGKLFHCEDDLIAYLTEEGGDVLKVN